LENEGEGDKRSGKRSPRGWGNDHQSMSIAEENRWGEENGGSLTFQKEASGLSHFARVNENCKKPEFVNRKSLEGRKQAIKRKRNGGSRV